MNAAEYRHERLKLSGGFMRLIQIQGGTRKDNISLRITQYASHRRPPYVAISYTWGSHTAETRQVLLNGRPFNIRINLWNLLFHLRQRGESRFIWVDAICIDQLNLEERNFHVWQDRMAKTYQNSVQTIVWLGLPSDDRRQARVMEFIAEMAAFRRKHSVLAFEGKYLVKDYAQRWTNLLELCRAAYWGRTWIIQEFVRASRVEALCGMASLDWKDFEDLVRTVRDLAQTRPSSPPTNPGALPVFIQEFMQTIPFRLTSRRLSHTLSSLEDLLSEFYDSKCAERRDKIYGVLGIADDCSDEQETSGLLRSLQPDYSKHILEVYFDVLRYLCEQSAFQAKSPVQGAWLVQRALGITAQDVQSYSALLFARAKKSNSSGSAENARSLLSMKLAEASWPLLPDYVNVIDEVLPGWTSIRDLRQKLDQVDWARYVGHEVRRKGEPRRPSSSLLSTAPTPRRSSFNSSEAGRLSPAGGFGRAVEYARAPLPADMIDNVISAASHSEDILHLYNYPSSAASAGSPTIPIEHILAHPHDKRLHHNATLAKPSVIIEARPDAGVDPVRIGFACTDVQRGDLLCHFRGVDVGLVARRSGTGIRLVGTARMCGHGALKEHGVHPSWRLSRARPEERDIPWSGYVAPSRATSPDEAADEARDLSGTAAPSHADDMAATPTMTGNPERWALAMDPISLWEILRAGTQ